MDNANSMSKEKIDTLLDVMKMKNLSDRIVRHPHADDWICYILAEYAKKQGEAFKIC